MNSAEPRGKEETGEGRAVGAGRGRATIPPLPRRPTGTGSARPAARPAAPFGRSLGEGSGHVPFPSRGTRRQVPWAPLGGARLPAKAARGLPPVPAPPAPAAPGSRPPSGAGFLHRCARAGGGGATHPDHRLCPDLQVIFCGFVNCDLKNWSYSLKTKSPESQMQGSADLGREKLQVL